MFSTSTLEHHSLKHLKDNLPIHPDDPKFSQQFACAPKDDAIPSTSKPKQNLPHEELIHKQAEAAKQFLKKEQDLKGGQTSFPCPSAESFGLHFLDAGAPKHGIKQGPVKSSKMLKEDKEVKTKNDDK